MPQPVPELAPTGELAKQVDLLTDACKHLMASQGKQLRKTIILEAAKTGASADVDLLNRAAIAVEMLHLASLAHDDLIDDADHRRGIESVGAKFGNLTAGLAGIWLFAQASEIMAECGDKASRLFSATASDICKGEMLEVKDLNNTDRTLEQYFAAVKGKTASLFSLAARIGADLSGAEPRVVQAFDSYGLKLGIAFQIADDLNDLLATDELTGKRRGSDLRLGVYTLPVIYALDESVELKGVLSHYVEDEHLDDTIAMIKATRGVDRAIEDCHRYVDAAKEAIRAVPHIERLIEIANEPYQRAREANRT